MEFAGLSPSEFQGSNQCGARQLAAVVTRDRNDLLIIDRSRRDDEIISFTMMPSSPPTSPGNINNQMNEDDYLTSTPQIN